MEEATPETERGDLVTLIRTLPFFDAFDSAILAIIEPELERVLLSQGGVLFQQGDPGDSMYILVRGLLRISTQRQDGTTTDLDVLDPGSVVGEMAVLSGQPRMATVASVSDAELIKLSKAGFQRLVEHHPDGSAGFAEASVPRWQRGQLVGVLTALFGQLDAAALHDLQAILRWQYLPAGAMLFRQGEPGDGLYIVVNGRLQFEVETPGGAPRVVDEIGRGESVGEFALLTGAPRTASVYASRDTNVVKLSNNDFERLLERYPQAMLQLTRMIVRRTQRSVQPQQERSRATTVALVPLGPGVPITPLAQRLNAALTSLGSTLHLSSTEFDRVFGREGAALIEPNQPLDVAVVGWLTEQELNYRHVIYETDPEWSAWTQRCIRQADRVILVAEASSNPIPTAVEAAIQQMDVRARVDLVLLQVETQTRPVGTRRWLEPRNVCEHHHVRLNNEADIRRLARRVSDQAVALVLSGGGARGFAHYGVMRALAEAGIEVDLVGGTSIGSLLAAMFVLELDQNTMYEIARTFASRKQLLDRTLPLASLMASVKVTALFRHLFKDIQIEDLWRPYFCVSSNLTRAEPVVHRQGPLWEAVRASTAIPGIFSPMLYGGDVLVDGAVMNHFPIDIMREQCGNGTLIAVNTSPRTEKLRNYQFGPSISGWQVLWSKLNPFIPSQRVPSIFHTLVRATEINSVYRLPTIQGLANILIEPPVERFRTLDFGAYEEIMEVGYRAAQEQLAAAPPLNRTSTVPVVSTTTPSMMTPAQSV